MWVYLSHLALPIIFESNRGAKLSTKNADKFLFFSTFLFILHRRRMNVRRNLSSIVPDVHFPRPQQCHGRRHCQFPLLSPCQTAQQTPLMGRILGQALLISTDAANQQSLPVIILFSSACLFVTSYILPNHRLFQWIHRPSHSCSFYCYRTTKYKETQVGEKSTLSTILKVQKISTEGTWSPMSKNIAIFMRFCFLLEGYAPIEHGVWKKR